MLTTKVVVWYIAKAEYRRKNGAVKLGLQTFRAAHFAFGEVKIGFADADLKSTATLRYNSGFSLNTPNIEEIHE